MYVIVDANEMPLTERSAHAITIPIFSFLAIPLLIVPFIFHYRSKNVGAVSLIVCLTLLNFFIAINAIIWPDENYASWYEGAGLCDVEAKLLYPLTTCLASSTLVITRNLAIVLDVDRLEVNPTRKSIKRAMWIDIAICAGVPVLQMALHYVIQINRYYIHAIGGCLDSYDNSWPTIVIAYMWPLIFSLLNCGYLAIVIYRLHHHRASISSILRAGSSNLNTSRFLRLFLLCFVELIFYTPVTIYFFYVNLHIHWLSYDWDIIHDPRTWNIIVYFPANGPEVFDHYVPPAMSVFVFFFFGLGKEAKRMYRSWALAVGMGILFPSLFQERRPSEEPVGSNGWMAKLSLVRWLKRYFNARRKGSAHVFADTGDSTVLPSGKFSTATTSLPTPTHATSNPSDLIGLPPLSPSPPSPIPKFTAPFSHTSSLLRNPMAKGPSTSASAAPSVPSFTSFSNTQSITQPAPAKKARPFPFLYRSRSRSTLPPCSPAMDVDSPTLPSAVPFSLDLEGSRSRHVGLRGDVETEIWSPRSPRFNNAGDARGRRERLDSVGGFSEEAVGNSVVRVVTRVRVGSENVM